MLKSIKNVAVLVCVCSVITLLLAITNSITAPIIKKNENASANAAFVELMPDGAGFDAIDISSYTLPSTVAEVYKESANKGYIVKLVTSGYGADMVIMCGVTSDGKITGAKCLSSNETLGKEKTYGENFKNKDSAGVEAVDTIAGATKTTQSYKNAVKDALNTAIILGGGSVDIRNEEEILADNLNSALPAGSGKFTKVFLTEEVLVDAIYVADNQTGYVCVIGEQFIGVDANGTVVTAGVENSQMVVDAVSAISTSTLTDIDLSAFPELSYAVSAKKTATGNYIIETKGAGYGIKGGNEYHPASGEYIVVRVSITASGEIIDCITVSQAETSGLGDACAKEDFYGQFVNKNETNYTEIDAISGATITTDGYKQAISRAFEVLKVLKGGNR